MRISSLRMVVAFLLAVALLAAPAGASAAPRPETGEASEGWLAALLRVVLEPVESLWAGQDEGPMMDPGGIEGPPPGSGGSNGNEGPMIDPN